MSCSAIVLYTIELSNPSNVTIIAKEYVIDGGFNGTTIISATALASDDAVGAFSCTISDLSDYYSKTLTVTPRVTVAGCGEQYVTGDPFTVTVPKKAITLTAASASKSYDGMALMRKSASTTDLISGHVLDSYNVVGSQTDAGTSDNVVDQAVIKNARGEDVTEAYDITYVPGVLNVLPREVTVKATDASKIYGQDDPLVFNTTITGRVPVNALTYTVSRDAGENVGTYTITPSGEALQGNYRVSYQPGVFTIQPATVTITVESASKVYGEEDPILSATVEGLIGNDVLDYTLHREPGDTVGEYAITVTLGDNPNYNVVVTNGTFTITKADAIVTITGATGTTDYNGSEQQVSGYTVSLPQGVTMTEDEIIGPANAVAVGTDAGTYSMGLNADDFTTSNNNYHAIFVVEDGSLTINKINANVTITGHHNTNVYDGQEHSVEGYDVEISEPLYTEADIIFSGNATAARTNVGTSEMGLASSQFANNNNNFANVTFNVTDGYQQITPLEGVVVTITGHQDVSVYNGQAHAVEGYDVEISNSLYTTADFSFSGTASASRTDVGTSNMELASSQFANTNSNFANVSFNVTDGYQQITPLEGVVVTITGHHDVSEYNGQEHAVEGYDVVISNPLYTTADFNFSGTASASRTDVGTSNMELASSQFANTNSNFTNVTFNVTDGYQQITPMEGVVVTITGHHDLSVYNGEEHSVEGYDVEISNSLYTSSDFSFSGTASASRTDVGTTNMELASSQFANTNTNFANVSFNVTDGYQQITALEGVVVTITGHHDASVYNGQAHTVEGYDVEISNSLYTTTDFSFSGTASVSRTDVGTSNMELASTQFANTNSNFANVSFNVTDGYQEITALEGVVVTITGHHDASVYNGQEHAVEGYDVEISNPLYTTADFSFNGNTSASRTDVGTTNMGLASTQFANTNRNFTNVTFNVTDGYQQITPLEGVLVTITGHHDASVYNGQEHSVEGYDVEISNPLYTTADFSFSGNASASRTDVGTTNMGLASTQFANTNSNFTNVSFNVTDGYQQITPLEGVAVTITGHHDASVYNGQEHAVEGYDVEINNSLYTTADFNFSGTASASRTDVGTTNMGLASSQFANTNSNFTNVSFNVTDGYQQITPLEGVEVTIIGHHDVSEYDGQEHAVEGYEVEINNSLYTTADFSFGGTDFTSRTDVGTSDMGLASTQFANTNSNFTNVSFNVTDGYQQITAVDGVEVTIIGHHDVSVYDGQEHAVEAYEVEISNSLYTTSDFSFSGNASASRTIVGTTNMGLDVSQFANTNSNFTNVSFHVTDGYQQITALEDVVVTITGQHDVSEYNGHAHVVEGYNVEISNPLYTTSDFSFSGNASVSRTDVGTSNMGLSSTQFANTNSNFTSVTFNVTDGYQQITAVDGVVVTIIGHHDVSEYDGQEHAVEAYEVGISNSLYTTSDFSFSGTASASRTIVGTTNMGLVSTQFANTNSNFTNVTFHVTDGYQQITAVDGVVVTIMGHQNISEYNGQAHTVEGYEVEINNSLYTSSDFSFSGSASASRTNVGITNMGLASTQFANTNTNFTNVTFHVTDGYQQITALEGVVVTITGQHDVREYDRQEHAVEGYNVQISNPLYTTSDFSFSGTASASRTDVGTTNMGLASSQFANTNTNFANVTFNVTDGYQQITSVDGVLVTITGRQNSSEYDREEHAVGGYDVEISNPLYTTSDFSFSGNASASRTNVGTTNMGLATSQFANTNTNFTNVTFHVTDGYQQITSVDGVVVTITGHHTVSEYDREEHAVEGYDVVISNPLYTTSDFSFSGNASASRSTVGITNMGLASGQFANTNTNFTNVTFHVTDGYQQITAVDGVVVTITGHHTVSEYDRQEHAVEGYDVEISNPLYTTADFSFSGNASASRTNVGTTNMDLSSSQFANIDTNFTNVTFHVTDGYQQITSVDGVLVTITGRHDVSEFDGEVHAVEGYDVETSNPLYTTADFSFSGNASANRTSVGTTYMGLTSSQFANTDTNFTNVTFNITDGYQQITAVGEVVVTITGHHNVSDYNGQEHAVEGYDVAISNPLYTSLDFSFSGTASASRTNVGTTNMGLSSSQFTNTSTNFTNVTFNVTDGYQQITAVEGVVVTITGHHNVSDYDGQEHAIEGYDVAISNPLYTISDFTFSGNATASRTNAGTSDMGLATSQFANTNTNFSNVIFYVTDGFQTINKINATVTITGHHNTSVYDGNAHVTEGYDVQTSTSLYSENDFSFSGDATASRTDVGTTNMGLASSQFANDNDNFAVVSFNVTDGYQTITKASVTVLITGATGSMVYNGSEQQVSGYSVSIPAGVTLTESQIIGPANAVASGTHVGTYHMGLTADAFSANNNNYNVSFELTDGVLTITRAMATVTAEAKTKVYGTEDPVLTAVVSGLQNGDAANVIQYTVSRAAGENAGTYTITPSGAAIQGDYNVTYVTASMTVTRAMATVTAEAKTKVYGATDPSLTAVVSGLQNGDAANVIQYIVSRTAGENVGTYTITPSGAATQGNYEVTYVPADFTITRATATVTAQSKTKVYGAADPALTASVSGLQNGDAASVIQYTVSRTAGENVGTYTITPSGATTQGNYDVTYETASLTITRATATVTAQAKTKVYGTADPVLTAVVSGLQNGDAASVIQYTVSRTAGENVGTYTITPSGDAVQANYNVTYVDAVFTITKALVTVTITGNTATLPYNGTAQSVSGYNLSIPAGTDLLASEITGPANAVATGTNVGTYSMGLFAYQFRANNNNYNVSFVVTDGALTITRAAAVVKANDVSKYRGEADPPLTVTITGLFGSDALSYTVSRRSGENAGTYTITPTGAANQGNYTVSYVKGTFTIVTPPCPTLGTTTYTPYPLDASNSINVTTVLDDVISTSYIGSVYYKVVSANSTTNVMATYSEGRMSATISILPAYRERVLTVTPYIYTTGGCANAGLNAGESIQICIPSTVPITLATATPYPASGLNKTQLFSNEGITLKARVGNFSHSQVSSFGFLISDNPDDIQTYNNDFRLPATFTNVNDTLFTHKIGMEYCKKTWYYRPYMVLTACDGEILYGEIGSVTMWGPEDYNPTATPITVTAGQTVNLSSTAYITISSLGGWKPIEYYLDPNGEYSEYADQLAHNGVTYENWSYYWKANGSQIYSSHTSGNTTHNPTQTTVYDAYCVFEINGSHCIVNGNPITVTVTQP